jgi:signal recognition particle GTPase
MQSADGVQGIQEDLTQIKEELRELRRLAGPASGAREGWKACEEDLRGVRRLVGTLVTNERALFIQQLTGPLETAYYWLLDTGLEADVVFTLVKELHDCLPLTGEELTAALRSSVRQLMAREVKTWGPLLDAKDAPKAVMIVGPTGVGKTTTIAKLAALYALRQKRKVALITLDTYRVAAVEQLRVYGKILGLPVDVALTCEDLAGLLRTRKSADLILIDTAGRSPLDQSALRELKKLVGPNRQVDAHLLLSAATREADLAVVVDRFMTLPVQSVMFSKLDETTQFGSVFNVLHRTGLPLSYLSTGQRVPEDLEVGTTNLVADLLMDGLAAIKTAPLSTHTQAEPGGQGLNRPNNAVPMVLAAPKENVLAAFGWALTRRSGKKSGA